MATGGGTKNKKKSLLCCVRGGKKKGGRGRGSETYGEFSNGRTPFEEIKPDVSADREDLPGQTEKA